MVVLVCVQHLLRTTGSLLEVFGGLGVRPDRIFVLGKAYSTNGDVGKALRQMGVQVMSPASSGRAAGFASVFRQDVQSLWRRAQSAVSSSEDRVVVLDDGGHALEAIPYELRRLAVGVEQTSSGVARAASAGIPVVTAALSAIKTQLEPLLVCRTILERSASFLPVKGVVGVVGLGNIGVALLSLLLERGYTVVCFDRDRRPDAASAVDNARGTARWATSAHELLERADVVFGCTGADILGSDWFENLRRKVTLISCSSEDLEFRSMIEMLYRQRRLQMQQDNDLTGENAGGGSVRIVRGGFPVNFDFSPESVPAPDIQLTRGLLLGSVVQALSCPSEPGTYGVEPGLQRAIVRRWVALKRERANWYRPDVIEGFEKLSWIAERSGGRAPSCEHLQRIFGGSD